MNKRTRFFTRTIAAAFLCTLFFGLTAHAEQIVPAQNLSGQSEELSEPKSLPGGGTAVDGNLRNVDTEDVTKGAGAAQISDGSDTQSSGTSSPVIEGSGRSSQTADTAASTASTEAGASAADTADNADDSASSSPVITAGSSQSVTASAVEKEETSAPAEVSVEGHRGVSLGLFTTTGYCNCPICSGGSGLTYSGTVPRARHTIAADLSLFPLGTRLIIGDVIYTVEDTGSGVVGRTLDIYYDNHAAAVGHGTKYNQEVFAVVD